MIAILLTPLSEELLMMLFSGKNESPKYSGRVFQWQMLQCTYIYVQHHASQWRQNQE